MASAGATLYSPEGLSYRLRDEIGRGFEGSVWSVADDSNLAVKIRHTGFRPEDIGKLDAMCRLGTDELSSVAAWPLKLLREKRSGPPAALLMRRFTNHASVNQLYAIKDRIKVFPEAQFPFLLHCAMNTARAFGTVHKLGQVIGDVNHSNLLISQKATVAMIDCDSFQIVDGSKTFFCGVGSPEFTPPELQGASFAGKRRTEQHDSFGLAVLIFYMLFLGRHPFMGVCDTKTGEIVSLDEAIAGYKFPYAMNESSPDVVLPKYVPRLSDYPADIGDLFKRAFTRESLIIGRPSAIEWVGALGKLTASTRQCPNSSSHQYPTGINHCPWCRVEGLIGTAIFGIRLTAVIDEKFNMAVIWSQIEAVAAPQDSLEPKKVDELLSRHTAAPELAGIVARRRKFRLVSIGVLVPAAVWAAATLDAAWAILATLIAVIVASNVWRRGSELGLPYEEEFKRAQAGHSTADANFLKCSVTVPLRGEKDKLRLIRAEYEALGPARAKRMSELDANRRQKQLQHHLERFRIEDAKIPLIGEKTTLLLLNSGILDAWDVERGRILSIKTFGPTKCATLLSWRAEKEQSFRFNPNQPVDPRDILAVEQEFRQKEKLLRDKLNAGPEILKQHIAIWRAQRRALLISLDNSADALAQAMVNRHALSRF